MNSTAPGSRLVTIAARSPARSITGPRRHAQRRAHLARDHVRERGLAEARRAVEQHVVERLAALARRAHEHAQVLAQLVLADELVERARAQAVLDAALEVRSRRRASVSSRGGTQRLLDQRLEARALGHDLERAAHRALRVRPRGSRGSRARSPRAAAVVGRGARRSGRAATSSPAPSSRRSITMRSAVFLPTPGMPDERRQVARAQRRDQLAARAVPTGSRARAWARRRSSPISSWNSTRSVSRAEAVQLQRVLAHVRVDAQPHGLALVGQLEERRERHAHLVADAVHVEHDAISGLFSASTPSSRAITARAPAASAALHARAQAQATRPWQIAIASASASSLGGGARRPSSRCTIAITCGLSARP